MATRAVGPARERGHRRRGLALGAPRWRRARLAQDKPTIYVIAPSLTDPFWITQQNGANQAGKDFGVNVVFQAPAQDTGDAGMVPLVQAAIAREARRHRDRLHVEDDGGRDRRGARRGHPGRALQQQPLRGRERAGRCAHPRASPSSARTSRCPARSWPRPGCRSLPQEPCKVLIVNPFPTAFVLTLRGDGVKRALDAARYPYADLAATGDQGQNLSLISAALQADPSICGIVGLGNPAANPAAQYVSENNLNIPVATFDVGAEAAKRIKDGSLDHRHQPAAVPAELLRGREPRQPG